MLHALIRNQKIIEYLSTFSERAYCLGFLHCRQVRFATIHTCTVMFDYDLVLHTENATIRALSSSWPSNTFEVTDRQETVIAAEVVKCISAAISIAKVIGASVRHVDSLHVQIFRCICV